MKAQDPKLVARSLSVRIDLAIKVLFFRHLLGLYAPEAERLYRWHILKRTGGVEPGGSKQTIEDYVSGCVTLLHSMQRHGFLQDHPVTVTGKGALQAGAHRLSCALVLERPVYVQILDLPSPLPWGREWLLHNKANEHDVKIIDEAWRTFIA